MYAQVDEFYDRRSGVAGSLVAGPFDAVGVVAGPLDGPGVGPVPALRVEVLLAGDVGLDRGAEVFFLFRGERPGRWPGG